MESGDRIVGHSEPREQGSTAVPPGGACLIILAGANLGEVCRLTDDVIVIGRDPACNLSLADEGVSRRHARVLRSAEGDFLLEDLQSTNGTYCNGSQIARQRLADGDRIVLGSMTVLKFAIKDDLEMSFHESMFSASVRDWLTKCYNKRYFEQQLELELKSAARRQAPLSLLMIDVDHFKHVNDSFGHRTGDHVLTEICARLRATLRSEDLMARFGGEELVILAREISRDGARLFAERCRQLIEKAAFELAGETIRVTISVGVCSLSPSLHTSPQAFVSAADAALYRAKRNGRNRVEVSEEASLEGNVP